jgi:glycosyltransferase involved in cell wall biosynthesis
MPEPRRILHVVNYAWPRIDGYVVRTMGLVGAQQTALGLDVTLAVSPFAPFAHGSDPDFTLPTWGPHLQREATSETPRSWERPGVGLAPRTSRAFTDGLIRLAREVRADVIHAHHPHYVGEAARRAARALGLPFVYEARCFNGDYDLDRINPYPRLRGHRFNALEYRLARRADAVVTISDGLARRLADHGVARDRLFVVRNSVDADRFSDRTRAPSAEVRVGYATSFEAIENLDALVEAAGKAREAFEQQGKRLRVVVAGTGRDWDRIRALVDAQDLVDVVELPGFVPYGQMPEFYHNLDLFVVPRGHATVAADTTPLKPLEALASGLPLLSTDLPALRELCAGRSDVRWCQPNAHALADALAAFARAPWNGAGAIDERTWTREIERYREVYAHATQHVHRR